MTYLRDTIESAPVGQLTAFIKYDSRDNAEQRAIWCREAYPDWLFIVGVTEEGRWAVAVSKPPSSICGDCAK